MRFLYIMFLFFSLPALCFHKKLDARNLATEKISERHVEKLANQFVLPIGATQKIKFCSSGFVSVSGGKGLQIKERGSVIEVISKKIGKYFLSCSQHQFQFDVISKEDSITYEKLKNWVSHIPGLAVTIKNSVPNLTGKLLRFEDWLDLSEEIKSTNGKYLFSAQLSSELQKQSQNYFEKLLSSVRISSAEIKLNPQAEVWLTPTTQSDKKAIEEILSPFGFEVQIDKHGIEIDPMVDVQIVIAEVKRKNFERLGIQWPASSNFTLLQSGLQPPLLSLQALEEKGLGKVLASPRLICRNNKEAEFLAGGEFPIKIANFKIQDVIWKKYGVLLKMQPKVDTSGRMSIAIAAEVSMIDDSQTVEGIPGLLTNRVQTHFDMIKERTIVLSGLIKQEWGKSRGGIPGLSQIPILGRLFSSEDYRENRSELLIFVTPKMQTASFDRLDEAMNLPPKHVQEMGGANDYE